MSNDAPTLPSKPEKPLDPDALQPIIPVLRELIQEESQRVITTVLKAESHSGPLPSPKQLAKYNELLPGTADIIIGEYQANGSHVRNMERLALEAQKDDNDRSRRVAERLVWASLASVIGLALSNHESVAIALAVTTVGAIISGFFVGKEKAKLKQNPEELG